MTPDELTYPGGLNGSIAPMWYYTNSSLESSTDSTDWWSLSPKDWNGSGTDVLYWSYVLEDLSGSPAGITLGVRPAISLKSCVKKSGGDGSASSPYTIKET